MKNTFVREKSLTARNCKYKEVDWFLYSEEEQEAVRRTRRTKTRASPPKVKQMNKAYSRKYFRWLFFNNFEVGDYYLTLTFSEDNLPKTFEETKRKVDNYIKRLRRMYRKNGVELKYLLVYEGRHSKSRLHWHLILNGGAVINRDLIEKMWDCGRANNDRLQLKGEKLFFCLSQYLRKEQAKAEKNERSWSASQNLLRPEKNPSLITDDYKISKRRMRKLQEAAKHDEVQPFVEKIYKGFELVHYTIGTNEVTGRPFARLRLQRRNI